MATPGAAVVYLARRADGVEPVKRFFAAYGRQPAGVDHDLVVLWKGFGSPTLPEEYAALVKGRAVSSRWIPDTGFDVDAYCRAAQELAYDRFCFLGSQSEPLVENWLAILFAALGDPKVGIAGATGSFESHYSQHVGNWRSLTEGPSWRRALWLARVASMRMHFAPFPNHHVRTTGFAIRAGTIRRVRCGLMRSKYDAFRFESGRSGLTAQIEQMGLRVSVVGRDGSSYPPARWPESRTFRLGDQDNVLVGDRHTRLFASADEPTRQALRRAAWGNG